MTKRAELSVRQSLAKGVRARAFPGLVALCLVALQLVTALHFALVPHGFNADGRGFVHVHRWLAAATESAPKRLSRPALVTSVASCSPDACPLGFAGPVSTVLASPALAGLIAPSFVTSSAAPSLAPLPRKQVLLNAPKTSPPRFG